MVSTPSALRVVDESVATVSVEHASDSAEQTFDGLSLAANRAADRRNVTLAVNSPNEIEKTAVTVVAQVKPLVQAANPKQDDIKSTKNETSTKPVESDFVQTSATVKALPVPGLAPGIELAGVVEDVTFITRTAELSTQGLQALEVKRRVLMDNPEVAIAVMAHTDDVGEESINQKLSMERAETVIRFFEKGGIDGRRLKPEGYGELLPLVQNMTDEDRKRNRRIEFRVLNEWPY